MKLKTFLYSQNSPSRQKTLSFFKKVKIPCVWCHEKTPVIPYNEKLKFAKHSFTTEFSPRNTTFSTRIATSLDVWATTFQCFQKRLKFRISKSCSSNLRLQEISGNRGFRDDLIPFLQLSDMILSLKHTGPSRGEKYNFWKLSFNDWVSLSSYHLTD